MELEKSEKELLTTIKSNKRKSKKFKFKRKKLKSNYTIKFLFRTLFTPLIIIIIIFILYSVIIQNKKFIKKLFHKKNTNTTYFICFCIMGKKENLYAREMVEHHKNIGFDKFVILDNNVANTEKFSDVLQDYIDDDLVEIEDKIGVLINQGEAFQYLYEKNKNRCKWLTFFDFDEFLTIYPQNGRNITVQEFLNNPRYDKCEAILINWLMYNDNELLHYDNRPLFVRFTQAEIGNYQNIWTKPIIRGFLNKTAFGYQKSDHFPGSEFNICDCTGKNITPTDAINPPVYEYAQITHFSTKSTEEYTNKIKRGYPGGVFPKPESNVELYFTHNKFTKEKLKIFEDAFNMTFEQFHNREE